MTDAILCDSCPHGHDRKTCKECNPQWSKKQTPRLSDAAKRLGEDRMSEAEKYEWLIIVEATGCIIARCATWEAASRESKMYWMRTRIEREPAGIECERIAKEGA